LGFWDAVYVLLQTEDRKHSHELMAPVSVSCLRSGTLEKRRKKGNRGVAIYHIVHHVILGEASSHNELGG
jgi:hypothetical protein